MERRQAFQFELRPNAEQRRQMSRFAGCARYVYNKARALKKELYEKKEQTSRFQLDKARRTRALNQQFQGASDLAPQSKDRTAETEACPAALYRRPS
jgi:transposase